MQALNEYEDCPTCLDRQLNQSLWFGTSDGDRFRRDGSARDFVAGSPTGWWGEPLLGEEWPPRSSR